MKKLLGFIGILAAVLIIIFIYGTYAGKAEEDETSTIKPSRLNLTSEQNEFIIKLINQNLLKLNPELNQAYIDPSLWRQMDYDLKKDFGASLAIYCGNKKGTHLYWVDIFDKMSGKKMAKYSQSWGFETY